MRARSRPRIEQSSTRVHRPCLTGVFSSVYYSLFTTGMCLGCARPHTPRPPSLSRARVCQGHIENTPSSHPMLIVLCTLCAASVRLNRTRPVYFKTHHLFCVFVVGEDVLMQYCLMRLLSLHGWPVQERCARMHFVRTDSCSQRTSCAHSSISRRPGKRVTARSTINWCVSD